MPPHKSINFAQIKEEEMRPGELSDVPGTRKEEVLERTLTAGQGTLIYMAPEVVRSLAAKGAHYGQPADIYSFSMVMYEVLELERPWYHVKSQFSYVIMDSVLAGKRPLLSDASREHNEYNLLMKRCWSHDPYMRPGVAEVASSLEVVKDTRYCALIKGTGSGVSSKAQHSRRKIAGQEFELRKPTGLSQFGSGLDTSSCSGRKMSYYHRLE